ncbi:conserved hypothetical protein [Burkholderia cenocepacia]|uniref:hypothetical protein n=1 Tax=Burkholderia cenocepacia TaxID=95486 RepID=UPI00192C7CA0|nr:hypothetical protein [Burkholderia cenocepacia]CAD9228081.1 conserved hypothetical protein [Burkholderia cenocepacia]
MATIEILSVNLEENEAVQFAAKAAAIQFQIKQGNGEEIESGFIHSIMSLIAGRLTGEDKSSFEEFNKSIFEMALLNQVSFNLEIQKLAEEAKNEVEKQTKH